MKRVLLRSLVVVVAAALSLGVSDVAGAGAGSPPTSEPSVTGPTIALDGSVVSIGDELLVTLSGFDAFSVTIVVCGNDGLRGSADCNMQAGRGLEIDPETPSTVRRITIAEPPVPCPCIVRAQSSDQSDVAVTSITLAGHPITAVTAPSAALQPLDVTMTAERASSGFFGRVTSALGGDTPYDVRIQVRNTSTSAVNGLAATAVASRGNGDTVVELDAGTVETLPPGHTWEQVVRAELPAPVFGSADWSVIVSGHGPATTAVASTSFQPIGFYVLAVLFVADVVYIAYRGRRRVRRARQRAAATWTQVEPERQVLVATPVARDDRVSSTVVG